MEADGAGANRAATDRVAQVRLADQQMAEWPCPKEDGLGPLSASVGSTVGGTAPAAVLLTVLLSDGMMATVHVSVTPRGMWRPLHRQLDKPTSLRAGHQARWLGARQGSWVLSRVLGAGRWHSAERDVRIPASPSVAK